MRRFIVAVSVVGAALCAAGAAVSPGMSGRAAASPVTIAEWSGQVDAAGQDAGSIAWCADTGLVIRKLGQASGSRIRSSFCASGWRVVLARAAVAWGGYEEKRCIDTHAAVYVAAAGAARRVATMVEDCTGGGDVYRGLVTDGTAFFYGVLKVVDRNADGVACDGDPCTLHVTGGSIKRIVDGHGVTVRGLPPAAEIAASDGRIALVAPAAAASWGGVSSGAPYPDFPRAATNGLVEVRRSSDAALVTRFRPAGIVRAIALSRRYAVVLVASGKSVRIEWYDVGSGARLGSTPVPSSTARTLSASGEGVVFAVGKAVRLLNLRSGSQRELWQASSEPVGLSITGGRVVWGENSGKVARVLALTQS